MRRLLFITAVLLFCTAVQQASAQRNLPGQKSFEVTGGLVDGFSCKNGDGEKSYFGSIGMTRTNRNHTHWLFALGYLQKDYLYREQILPKVQFTGEAGIFMPIVKDRGQNIALTFGTSALAGYETSNWGEKTLDDGSNLTNKDSFI